MESSKYCALCPGESHSVWTLSDGKELAIVPLCIQHEPLLRRLFNLCKEQDAQLNIPEGMLAPGRGRAKKVSMEPLEWEPPKTGV